MENASWAGGRMVDLTPDECWRLTRSRSVGRMAWNGPDGPTVVPVNYAVSDGAIWLRTTAYSALARECDNQSVSFEIDEVDVVTRAAWSVLIRGTAHTSYDADDLPADWPGIDVWPAGARPLHLVIRPRAVTGKRLLAH